MESKRYSSADALTAFTMDLFRLNSRLLITGDRLVAELGLTSARWQILGAIVGAGEPQPVAWIARDMGGARQNVQRIVNDLKDEGIVEFLPNPHHRRAHLVQLTEKGKKIYQAALNLWSPFVKELARGLPKEGLDHARGIVTTLRERLEARLDSAIDGD